MLFWQDVVLTVPPYPYAVDEPSDVPLNQGWVVTGQASAVFLLPSAAHGRTAAACTARTIHVYLVFYSTFEPVDLPEGGPMEAVAVQKLYKPSPTLCWPRR